MTILEADRTLNLPEVCRRSPAFSVGRPKESVDAGVASGPIGAGAARQKGGVHNVHTLACGLGCVMSRDMGDGFVSGDR